MGKIIYALSSSCENPITMASCVDQALVQLGSVGNLTKLTLSVIGDADVECQRLTDIMMRSTPPENGDNENADFENLRCVLEDLSEKKSLLAIRSCDLIEQHVKILDEKMRWIDAMLHDHEKKNLRESFEIDLTGRKQKKLRLHESRSCNSEPQHCLCKKGAFGDMIACTSDTCPTVWFHLACISPPKVQKREWMCFTCSVERKKNAK